MDEEAGEEVDEGLPAWMGTFADMMSLLLTFFILILSFANMDVIKFSAAVASLQDAFGTALAIHEYEGSNIPSPITFSAPSRTQLIELDIGTIEEARDIRRDIEDLVERANLDNLVDVDETDRGVVVRVVGQLLFDPGSVELRPESFVLLKEIAVLIKAIPGPVSIEGHTDNTPAGDSQIMSNWQLSAGRAISVLSYLESIHELDSKRFSVSGFSSTRPLVPNNTDENRETNRRVEFVFPRDRESDPTSTG